MKVESREERRNDILKRTEYIYILSHPAVATPSRKDVQKMVASELSVSPRRVEVRKIYSFFGQPKSRIRVYVWDEERVDDLNAQAPDGQAEGGEGNADEAKSES